MKWEVGRQGTGYRKLRLAEGQNWDCYLIDYPPHTHIGTHTDPVPGKKHYRLNIMLWGEDNFQGDAIFSSKHIKFFRPDISPHSVGEVSRRRIIFSVGWIR
jgi:hypothetical protein